MPLAPRSEVASIVGSIAPNKPRSFEGSAALRKRPPRGRFSARSQNCMHQLSPLECRRRGPHYDDMSHFPRLCGPKDSRAGVLGEGVECKRPLRAAAGHPNRGVAVLEPHPVCGAVQEVRHLAQGDTVRGAWEFRGGGRQAASRRGTKKAVPSCKQCRQIAGMVPILCLNPPPAVP